MTVKFEPLRNLILLELEPTPEKSSVIALANLREELSRYGTIRAVGPEVKDAKVGQRVLASITAAHEVPGGLHLIPETAIIGLGN